MNNYYIYAYLREDKTPYYVGKGSGNRAYEQHRINGKGVHTPKDKSRIVFPETNLTELGSFALERRLIQWYGRKDLGTGILHNKTDGGDGVSGRIYKHSDETKKKISAANKGRKLNPLSDDRRIHQSIVMQGKPAWNKGKSPSIETRQKLSTACTGRQSSFRGKTQSDEAKQKISNALKGRVAWNKGKLSPFNGTKQETVVCPFCNKSGAGGSMKRWHFENCKEAA